MYEKQLVCFGDRPEAVYWSRSGQASPFDALSLSSPRKAFGLNYISAHELEVFARRNITSDLEGREDLVDGDLFLHH